MYLICFYLIVYCFKIMIPNCVKCYYVQWWSHPCAPSISFREMWRQSTGAKDTVMWTVYLDLRMWADDTTQKTSSSSLFTYADFSRGCWGGPEGDFNTFAEFLIQSYFFLALFFSVLAYQKPNAKKLRRTAQRAEQLAAKGVVPRRQKLLLNRRPVQRTTKKAVAEANNNPNRDFYDIWDQERKSFMVVSAISWCAKVTEMQQWCRHYSFEMMCVPQCSLHWNQEVAHDQFLCAASVQWWSHPCAPSISIMGMWRSTWSSDDCYVNSRLGSEDKLILINNHLLKCAHTHTFYSLNSSQIVCRHLVPPADWQDARQGDIAFHLKITLLLKTFFCLTNLKWPQLN